jgi:hypothetical protein
MHNDENILETDKRITVIEHVRDSEGGVVQRFRE